MFDSIKKFERFLDEKTYSHIKEYGHYPHWSDKYKESGMENEETTIPISFRNDAYKEVNTENEECSRLVGGTVSLEEINERLKKVERQQKKILKHLKNLKNTVDDIALSTQNRVGVYDFS